MLGNRESIDGKVTERNEKLECTKNSPKCNIFGIAGTSLETTALCRTFSANVACTVRLSFV